MKKKNKIIHAHYKNGSSSGFTYSTNVSDSGYLKKF